MSLYDFVQRQGTLPQNQALHYIQQIGAALTAIHKTGLVHWDVTPSNIMLKNNGDAILIDFGIAGDCPPTTLSRTFGNRAFAPWEQFMLGQRTPAVDLYTLAATLYYAVTGKMPTPAGDRKLQNEPLIPPVQYLPTLDTQLNIAILLGMELEPQNRPQSVAVWLEQLTLTRDELHIQVVKAEKVEEEVEPKSEILNSRLIVSLPILPGIISYQAELDINTFLQQNFTKFLKLIRRKTKNLQVDKTRYGKLANLLAS